jgi:hypothetical protein
MICHTLSSLNPYCCRGKWDAGQGSTSNSLEQRKKSPPQSLQYLSLRNSSPKVNQLPSFNYHSPKGIASARFLLLPLPLPFCLSSRQGSAVAVACSCSYLSDSHPRRESAFRTPPLTPPTQHSFPPPVTIHHFPLDAILSTFYSLRIFDTLAPLANPVAVTKRTFRAATNPWFHLIQSPESFGPAVNPASPDGGQHTT